MPKKKDQKEENRETPKKMSTFSTFWEYIAIPMVFAGGVYRLSKTDLGLDGFHAIKEIV